tara:strand:+ start:349 stop:450 length:102 start_codon:yes stop_codon:yes gene_type:complete
MGQIIICADIPPAVDVTLAAALMLSEGDHLVAD